MSCYRLNVATTLESCQKVFTIPKSGEIKITKIFDKSYGSSGHGREIFAKSKRESDTEFSSPPVG